MPKLYTAPAAIPSLDRPTMSPPSRAPQPAVTATTNATNIRLLVHCVPRLSGVETGSPLRERPVARCTPTCLSAALRVDHRFRCPYIGAVCALGLPARNLSASAHATTEATAATRKTGSSPRPRSILPAKKSAAAGARPNANARKIPTARCAERRRALVVHQRDRRDVERPEAHGMKQLGRDEEGRRRDERDRAPPERGARARKREEALRAESARPPPQAEKK